MGILYLVPTPVGNLEDITLRALRILKEVDVILAEDTRTSGVLLKHFDIKKRMFSHHMHNEHDNIGLVLDMLKEGQNVAVITDAGTPGISDPGFLLCREAIAAGLEVQALPGPTAFVPAVVASGIPCDRFTFEGFFPSKKGRVTRMEEMMEEERTMIFYESPHRLLKTLELFSEYFGVDRQVCVCREISKVHEERIRGTLAEVILHFEQEAPRGEIVVVVAGAERGKARKKVRSWRDEYAERPERLEGSEEKVKKKETRNTRNGLRPAKRTNRRVWGGMGEPVSFEELQASSAEEMNMDDDFLEMTNLDKMLMAEQELLGTSTDWPVEKELDDIDKLSAEDEWPDEEETDLEEDESDAFSL